MPSGKTDPDPRGVGWCTADQTRRPHDSSLPTWWLTLLRTHSALTLLPDIRAMNTVAGYGFSPASIAFTTFINLIEILGGIYPGIHFHQPLLQYFYRSSMEGAHHPDANGGHDDAVII